MGDAVTVTASETGPLARIAALNQAAYLLGVLATVGDRPEEMPST
jgi:hypothetical protein